MESKKLNIAKSIFKIFYCKKNFCIIVLVMGDNQKKLLNFLFHKKAFYMLRQHIKSIIFFFFNDSIIFL